ncbi:MAG: hypothetical protein ACREF7_00270 [Candidatus Saccharimonadales bacterium]
MNASALNVSIDVDVSSLTEAMKKAQSAATALDGLKSKCSEATVALKGETTAHKDAAIAANTHAAALKQLGTIGTSAIGGLAEGMTKMTSGQKNINPLGDLAKTIGKQITKMGEAWLASGIGMTIGLDPMGPLKIAEGTALVAAGSAFSAIKMASGGIVSGSSIVNVGEYAGASHNPEVIAPLDKLNSMMPSQNQSHSFEIKGDNLVSILQRANNNTNFALGQ